MTETAIFGGNGGWRRQLIFLSFSDHNQRLHKKLAGLELLVLSSYDFIFIFFQIYICWKHKNSIFVTKKYVRPFKA